MERYFARCVETDKFELVTTPTLTLGKKQNHLTVLSKEARLTLQLLYDDVIMLHEMYQHCQVTTRD